MADRKVHRRLAAILAADVAGYTQLMEQDTDGTVAAWKAARDDIVEPTIDDHSGHIIKFTGDGFLVEFPSVEDAVNCAIQLQDRLAANPLDFRIGINLGDITDDGKDIHGEGVNIAARLEGLAEPGGICISGDVYRQVRNRIEAAFEDLGERELKHVSQPVRIYAVNPPAAAASAPPLPDKPSIAVLPFNNLSGDLEQEYFSDGITEDIITDLSKVSGLFVIARNSTFVYKNKAINVADICRELGVKFAVEGSVRKVGNRVRITAQLIDGSSGGHLWAERYDRDLTDIFEVQDDVTQQIVSALKVSLSDTEKSLIVGGGTTDIAAHDLFLKGRALIFGPKRDLEMFDHAMPCFRRAIELDPNYAGAYAGLAMGYALDYQNHWSDTPESSLDQAQRFVDEAIAKDDNDPLAHYVAAVVATWKKDYERWAHEDEKALALNPNFAPALSNYGTLHIYTGEPAKAIPLIERATRLDPVSQHGQYVHFLGMAYFVAGEYEIAATCFRDRISINPTTDLSRAILASALGHLDQPDQAQQVWRELMQINPEYSYQDHFGRLPFKNPADAEKLTEGLRKAGLAERAEQNAPAVADKPSMVVLPFDNMSGDQAQEYFADGLTEDIITELSRFQSFFVIARHSAFVYKDKPVNVQDVGRELGVQYVVEGSVRKAGRRLRVTAQLIEAASGNHVWAERYDHDLRDMFDLQDEITRSIVAAIPGRLEKADLNRIKRKRPEDMAVYDYVLRGKMHHHRATLDDNAEALRLLDKAIELDPEFAEAYAWKACTLGQALARGFGDDKEDLFRRDVEAVEKALSLDDNNFECHWIMCEVRMMVARMDEAERHHQKALTLNPNDPRVVAQRCELLTWLGRPEEGADWARQAMRLNPFDAAGRAHLLGRALYIAGSYEDAVEAFKQVPTPSFAHHAEIAACHALLGSNEKASLHAGKVLSLKPDFSIADHVKGLPFTESRDREHYRDGLRKARLPA